MGNEPRSHRVGQSVFLDDRSSPGRLAGFRGAWSGTEFLQGIGGTLELFHRSTLSFQKIVGEATGHPVAVFQRIDQAGYKLPIDERVLADTDTLMVFGLDHLVAEQEAEPGEIDAIREWLKREGTCLLLAPHHDVGFTERREAAADGISPPWRRTRASPAAIQPVHALADEGARRPGHQSMGASSRGREGTKEIAPLTAFRDLDKLGLLNNVTTFNFHLHLPHYEVTTRDAKSVHVLGRQLIDPDRPHPFTAAGNKEFNCLLWLPPTEQRAGDILLIDSTHFTTLFGGTDSLANLWRNLALMK